MRRSAILIIGHLKDHWSSTAFLQKLTKMTMTVNEVSVVISAGSPGEGPEIIHYRLPWQRETRSRILNAVRFTVNQLYVSVIVIFESIRFKTLNAVIIPPLIVPIVELRCFGTKVFLYRGGDISYIKMGHFENIVDTLMRWLPLKMADHVVVEGKGVIDGASLNDYIGKILVLPQYVDTNKFFISRAYNERSNHISYIGGLFESKGLIELIEAVRIDSTKLLDRGWQVRIIGDGPLRTKIQEAIHEVGLEAVVELCQSLTHDQVAVELNDTKLLILPSRTEGLPNIVLEAMACGTPVLATPVGGIPDIIKDGYNGFLLESQSPPHIAREMVAVIARSDLDAISERARETMEGNNSYKAATARWKEALEWADRT